MRSFPGARSVVSALKVLNNPAGSRTTACFTWRPQLYAVGGQRRAVNGLVGNG